MNPNMFIVINVSSASEAIEAYKAILAAQSSATTVTLSSREERQDAEDMKRFNQGLASKVQSSGCSSSPRVSEEQTLRDEYRKLHPLGRGFRLTKQQTLSCKVNGAKSIDYLRLAVQQMKDGTYQEPSFEANEPQAGEDHPDSGEYF
jgi:hypothetical protein